LKKSLERESLLSKVQEASKERFELRTLRKIIKILETQNDRLSLLEANLEQLAEKMKKGNSI